MELTREQSEQIQGYFPRQRGNVRLDNLRVLNTIFYVCANGCKWRTLPEHFGRWHTIYTRMMQWSQSGGLDRIFEQLQRRGLMPVRIEAISLDSTIVQARCHGHAQNHGTQYLGRSREGWRTNIHRVAADDRNVVTWSLPPGQAGDAPEGRQLLQELGPHDGRVALLMDCAYQDNATREWALNLGLLPVVPPAS